MWTVLKLLGGIQPNYWVDIYLPSPPCFGTLAQDYITNVNTKLCVNVLTNLTTHYTLLLMLFYSKISSLLFFFFTTATTHYS